MKRWMLCLSVVVVVACGGSKEEAKPPSGEAPKDGAAEPKDEQSTMAAMAEAFAKACEGKAAGDECTASAKDGDKELSLPGKCVQPPEESGEKRVVCLPNQLPE